MKSTTFLPRFIIQASLAVLAPIIFLSCKKDEIKPARHGSLNIVNAVVAGAPAKLANRSEMIWENSNLPFALSAGENGIYIYPETDSLNPYYNNNKFTIGEGELYSLFLTGVTAAIESVLIKENLPDRKDGSAGIRFINLAPNTPSLDITLSVSNTINEVSDLEYKNYTEFKNYPAPETTDYIFEIRDAATAAPADPLATFFLPASQVPRFANITLVVYQSGAGIEVFRVNNDR